MKKIALLFMTFWMSSIALSSTVSQIQFEDLEGSFTLTSTDPSNPIPRAEIIFDIDQKICTVQIESYREADPVETDGEPYPAIPYSYKLEGNLLVLDLVFLPHQINIDLSKTSRDLILQGDSSNNGNTVSISDSSNILGGAKFYKMVKQ